MIEPDSIFDFGISMNKIVQSWIYDVKNRKNSQHQQKLKKTAVKMEVNKGGQKVCLLRFIFSIKKNEKIKGKKCPIETTRFQHMENN